MKGWRPSACQGSTPDRAFFKRAFSCWTSDRSACLFPRGSAPRPGLMTRGSMDPGFPFSRSIGSAAAESDKRRPSVRDLKNGASPSPRSKRPEELEMKTKATTSRANGRRRRGPVASFKAGRGARNKKCPGGRRKPLIRLDSAKEIEGFSWLYFGRTLLDEARFGSIWIWLGKKFGRPAETGTRGGWHVRAAGRSVRERHARAGAPDSATRGRRALVWPLAPCYAAAGSGGNGGYASHKDAFRDHKRRQPLTCLERRRYQKRRETAPQCYSPRRGAQHRVSKSLPRACRGDGPDGGSRVLERPSRRVALRRRSQIPWGWIAASALPE